MSEVPKSGAGDASNVLSTFIGNVMTMAREKVLGESWWVPSSDSEIVEVPSRALRALVEAEHCDVFSIYSENTKNATQRFHLVLTWRDGQLLSLRRSTSLQAQEDFFHSLLQYSMLFRLTENRKLLSTLLTQIETHKLWQAVHIAAKLGLMPYFERLAAANGSECRECMNSVCQPEGSYPLHIAIENDQVDLVVFMLDKLHASIAQTDVQGQNAFHYAAKCSSAAILALSSQEGASECINSLSNDGYTPLFLAVKSMKPSCIAALYKNGAILNVMCHGRSAIHEAMLLNGSKVKDVVKTLAEASPEAIYAVEAQSGNSALHLASSKQNLIALLNTCRNIDLNVRNKAGQTALHLHTFAGNIGCVVTLLSYGADIDAQDSNGNTCLHVAVSRTNVLITKALLVFGADVNVLNKSGHSARHMAAKLNGKGKELIDCLTLCEARRCGQSVTGCLSRCSARNYSFGEFSNKTSSEETKLDLSEFKQKKCIGYVEMCCRARQQMSTVLCLDGGGIRGLILVMVLLYIQKHLHRPIIEYIDWIAGTSTGAILASGLLRGKSLRECQRIYVRLKDLLFDSRMRPYDSELLTRFIQEEIGADTTLADITDKKLIIMTVLADKHPIRLHMFRNYKLPVDATVASNLRFDDPRDIPLWKALRCSSAAPTYFETVDKRFVDGGLIANNPTLDLLSEINLYNTACEYAGIAERVHIGCVLSIGTGRIPDVPIEALNLGTSNPLDILNTFKNLGRMVLEQVSAAEGRPVDRSRAWCHQANIPFFRFSTQMSKDYPLDTKDDNELVLIMWETLEYMRSQVSNVLRLAHLLEFISKSRPPRLSG